MIEVTLSLRALEENEVWNWALARSVQIDRESASMTQQAIGERIENSGRRLADTACEQTSLSASAASSEAETLRAEIIAVGRKLWERSYVDGNGGNISVRLGEQSVLCTPTLISKGDLPTNLPVRSRRQRAVWPRTAHQRTAAASRNLQGESEGAFGCSLPSAACHGIRDHRYHPPIGLIPEYEMFIGPSAVARYETPGTQAFAETVLPFVQDHNTILLANHGIVCWADTVTHAEWLVEILENYCKTYLIAQQIGKPLTFIPTKRSPRFSR